MEDRNEEEERNEEDLMHSVALKNANSVFLARQRAEHALIKAKEELEARTIVDVTERKRAEEALRLAQAELAHVSRVTVMGEIAASIAHEVNQPLAAVVINGNAALRWLAADPPNLEEARAAMQRVISDGNRASDVTGRIRRLLRKTAPEKLAVNVNDVVRETLVIKSHELERHRIEVDTDLVDGMPAVLGDRVQLQQAS